MAFGPSKFRRVALCSAIVSFGGILALAQKAPEPQPLVPAAKLKMLREKAARKRANSGPARFDKPAEAMAFYANKRTGAIETRGPNPTTGVRRLDPDLYRQAIQSARSTPFYSTATGAVAPSGNAIQAPAGGALATWSPLGPNNQGGRTRQLVIDPNNADIMYAAAVSGGVWKTTNGGSTWSQLTDLAIPNLAVVSLAMDPKNSQVLYAGTGEGFFNADAIVGFGIYKTTDGGATWSPLASTVPAPGSTAADFNFVSDIVVSPRGSQRLYATTRTGVFRSIDGGVNWTQIINGAAVNGCHDLAIQVNRAIGYVFASCGTFAQGTVYRILDTNTGASAVSFTTPNMGRTSLAIAPSNQSIIYAMAASTGAGNFNGGLLGVFRSTANGNPGSWTTQVLNSNPNKLNTLLLSNPVYGYSECVGGAADFYNQGWYDNVIAVDPLDPNRVWAGGIDLFRSDDGGQNWGVASYWWFGQGDSNYAHADNHVITFHPGYNGTSNKKMFVASDGGVFRTDDARAGVGTTVNNVCGIPAPGQTTWTELNTNYTTTQFYHGSVYPDGGTYFGGFQDNGTWRGTTASTNWTNLLGGDGGYTAVDTLGDGNAANDVLFGEYTNLSLQRSTNGGTTWSDAVAGITEASNQFLFIAPFAMNAGNRQQLWNGGFYIWRTTDQATSWTQASALTAGNGSVASVAVAPTDPNRVIVGMSDGYIHSTTTALSNTSTTSWPFTRPRTVFVTSLAFDPTDANIAYATFATFSGTSVYKSTNGGASWVAIPGTGANLLPRVPATSVVVDPTNPSRVYVGTDIGVYTSIDSGANWYREVTGFANVSVEHLEINTTGTKRLYAFTHGRGAWRVDLVP
jgi:hypothetical protein